MRFKPPKPEQVTAHLQRHPPRGRSPVAAWLPMIALGLVVGLTFTAHEGLLWVLPWLILGGVFGYLSWRVRWLRQVEQQANRVQEMGMLRQWPQTLRLAWRLLPSLTTLPELHGRVVAAMAWSLHEVKAHDASIVAYDYLIDHLPQEHPAAVHLRVQRILPQLASDRLADADEALRRLRYVVDQFKQTTISATYRLAVLFQQVRTHHFADAVEQSDDLIDALRPLGVEAGFGHALMALSHHRLAQHQGSEQSHQQARLWWSRATLLLGPAILAGRFDELEPLTRELEASPRPFGGNGASLAA